MTEEEWLTSDDPVALLCGLDGLIPLRKYLMFELGSTASLLSVCPDDALRRYYHLAELKAEGLPIGESEVEECQDAVYDLHLRAENEAEMAFARSGDIHTPETAALVARHLAIVRVMALSGDCWSYWIPELRQEGPPTTFDDHVNRDQFGLYRAAIPLLRCVVGNPFRPVALDSGWRTSAVVALAEGIYADRAWDRLPILADALEDAGCTNPDVVTHLRERGPHARGCWAVDLILGKA